MARVDGMRGKVPTVQSMDLMLYITHSRPEYYRDNRYGNYRHGDYPDSGYGRQRYDDR